MDWENQNLETVREKFKNFFKLRKRNNIWSTRSCFQIRILSLAAFHVETPLSIPFLIRIVSKNAKCSSEVENCDESGIEHFPAPLYLTTISFKFSE